MLNLPATLRESSRLLLGSLIVALALLAFCLIALGYSGLHAAHGALRGDRETVGRVHLAAPLHSALAERRNARRRVRVSRRIPVVAAPPAAPAAPQAPPAGEPASQLTEIETPAPPAAPNPKPGPTPASTPTPEPPAAPAPEPPATPDPTPEPAPAPEPPPATPDPPPAPEPEPEPPVPSQPEGEVLFKATFDSGFGGWYVQSLPGRASLPSSDPFEGNQAARFEVRPGDVEPDTGSQRSEVSGPTFDEGQDLYIRDAIRIPAANSFNVPWQIIQQLHEEDWAGSPGIAVFLDNKHALKLGAGDGSPTFWQGPALQSDRWYDLVYRVNLSQSSSTGFIEVWLDGVQQKLANGQARIYGQTIQAAETYLKAGIYRSKTSTGTSIVEHDAIAVGTSYAAVTAG